MTAKLFQIVPVTLSDGSTTYNVQGTVDGHAVVIGCTDATHANVTADALNDAAWVEVVPNVLEAP